MDLRPGLRDIRRVMWIRPDRVLLARMPSLRPGPSVPAKPLKNKSAAKASTATKPATPLPPPRESTEEDSEEAGGFHESSYELRTGMEMFESDWPDDVTLPGSLDENDPF
jgi:hypothetical protein